MTSCHPNFTQKAQKILKAILAKKYGKTNKQENGLTD